MSEYEVSGPDLKKMLVVASKGPISFGFNPGKSPAETFLGMHKTRPVKALGKAAKDEGKGAKYTFGTAEVVDKTLRLTCERELPQMAKQMSRYLKSQKVMMNVEIFDLGGNLLESEGAEELPEDTSAPAADASVDTSAATAPASDNRRAALEKRLSSMPQRIKALPPEMGARVAKHFQTTIGLIKAGDLDNAEKIAEKIEAVLDKMGKSAPASDAPAAPPRPSKPAPGGAAATPPPPPPPGKSVEDEAAAVFGESLDSGIDPAQLRALKEQMVQLAKAEVPAMVVRLKAQSLQKAKGLLDSGRLDEAGKLLDALAAKVGRPGQAPKADWKDQAPPAPPPPSDTAAATDSQVPPAPPRPSDSTDATDIPAPPPAPAALDKRTFEGVDFGDNDKVLDLVIKHIEEIKAQENLITLKLNDGADKKWAAVKTDFSKITGGLYGADDERKKGYKELDGKKVDNALKDFNDLIKQKKKLTADLKPLWLNDQKNQLAEELKKNKKSSSKAMEANFGDNFLEMAQMATVQAKNKKLDLFKASKDGVKKPMEMGEVAAIYGYSTQDYTKINGLLRGNQDPDVDPKAFLPYIKACTNGLKKLPAYKGVAVRCDRTAWFLPEVLKSGKRTEKAFMSAGTRKVPNFGEVVTHITKVKTGKEVTAFSLHQTEGEVLFPPGSVFKFVKFVDAKGNVTTNYKDLAKVADVKTDTCQFFVEQVK